MTSRERVLNAYNHKGYDRIPIKHEATPEVNRLLIHHFGLRHNGQLLAVVGDDFRYVEPVYKGPPLKRYPDGSFEGWFGSHFKWVDFGSGRYLESASLPYADVEKVEDLDRSRLTRSEWFDYSTIKEQCEKIRDYGYVVCFGSAGDLSFINGIGRYRGQQQVFMDIIDQNPVYMELVKARFDFYYHLHENTLAAADGLIDFVHVGEDLGDQLGPVISPELFDRILAPLYRQHFEMVHRYKAKTMMHMCGHVRHFLSRLIELGLDVYDVVQPTTPDMDIAELKRDFGDKLCFCGSVCAQTTMVEETPEGVAAEVKRRLELFSDGGLFLGPSHAIQVGTPLENILSLYRTAGSLMKKIDESVMELPPPEEAEVNLFKLFG